MSCRLSPAARRLRDDHDLSDCPTFIEDPVGITGSIQAEAVRHDSVRVQALACQESEQVLHLTQPGDPRAMQRELVMDERGAGGEGHLASLAYEHDPTPLPRARKADLHVR